jgi:hypothetical protein
MNWWDWYLLWMLHEGASNTIFAKIIPLATGCVGALILTGLLWIWRPWK